MEAIEDVKAGEPSEMVKRLALIFAQHGDHFFDNDGPSNASWDDFSPREQLVATAAARAAIEAYHKSEPFKELARWVEVWDRVCDAADPDDTKEPPPWEEVVKAELGGWNMEGMTAESWSAYMHSTLVYLVKDLIRAEAYGPGEKT